MAGNTTRHVRCPSLVAFILIIQWYTPHCSFLDNAKGVRGAAAHSSGAQVYYVTDVAEKLSGFSEQRRAAADNFHLSEQGRLQAAIRGATQRHDKELLQAAAEANEESRLESMSASQAMLSFVTTLKQAMGSRGRVSSCGLLACGDRAYCGTDEGGARCLCDSGYEGDGFVCRRPRHPQARLVFRASAGSPQPRITDLHAVTFAGGRIAVVFRDVSRNNQGFIAVGKASHDQVDWGNPLPFSNGSEAFGPVLVELQDSPGIAIAFRDSDRGGSGVLVGGTLDLEKGLADFGPPRDFARRQAQKMGLVALPGACVAVVFAEHALAAPGPGTEGGTTYGSAILARVKAGAAPELLGKRRFATGAVARLATTMVSPSSFLVAFRRGGEADDGARSEASCAVAWLRGEELVFEPRTLSLEPDRPQVWARSLAALGNDTVAYTYHSGAEQLTKQAVLRVDPRTHELELLQRPAVIGKGFSPYAGTLSTTSPLAQHHAPGQLERLRDQGPRVVSFFAASGSARPAVRFCKVAANGLPGGCEDLPWPEREATSVVGAPVGDGRIAFVFADARGTAFYHLVGLMDPF